MLPTPDAPTVQVTAATCEAAGTATITNYNEDYSYTFDPTGPVAGANGVISGMTYGTSYTVTATNSDDCISAASASFTIEEMLPTPDAPTVQVTAATCFAAGTATISNYNADYSYTFDPTGPTAGTGGVISGMTYGTSYTVTATNSDECISAASAPFIIMDMLPTPAQPTVQVTAATCFAAGTATISNYNEDYSYTFDPTGPTAGTGGVISGFSTDVSYTVTATSSSNCTSEASEPFVVPAALDAPMQPTVSTTAATCEAAGTATISNYDANYTYTFSPTGPVAGANGVITGAVYGTSYTVTATNSDDCISASSASFTIEEMLPTPVTPTVQVTAATCFAAGTATISNYDANYTYTFSPTGPVAGANGVITGAVYGTSYTVTATNSDDCISAASASFTIEEMLPTPDAPTVQVTAATCEAAGTATISNYDANYTYTFSPTGPVAGANGVITGAVYGTSYTVTATNSDDCTSEASASFTIEEILPTPVTPTVQVTAATCFAAGTATISNYSEDYTYTFDPTGPTAGTGGVISGFSTDVSYTVTATSSSNCTSEASELFMVPAALDAPMQPTVQVTAATCEAAGTATITNYNEDYSYTFDPTGPLAGANGVISNMTYGTSYTVTATNSDECISAASAPFIIMDMLPTPAQPIVQVTAATCFAAGTATISNYNEDYSYTFDPTGPLAGANGVISNMTYGTSYTVTATNSDDCISAASASFTIEEMLPTPDAPTVQVTTATCEAAGTATITNYNEDYSYTFDPTGPTAGTGGVISNMTYGTSYTVTATNSDECISAASAPFIIMDMLPTPAQPIVQVTAATCFAAGTATISNYSEDYSYTFDPTGPTAGTGGVISGFSTDVSYTVTATSSSNCTSEASELFMVPAALDAPMQPTVSTTAATCEAAGTATISNYDANYTYTFSPTGPVAGANGVITGAIYGTSYTVTATNSDDCISASSASFTIEEMLPTPDAPTVQVTAATCEAAGTATITNYNEDYSYTFDPTGPLAGANGVISNMTYGTSYTVTATNSDDCISAASASFTIEEMLPTPDAPTVQVTAATCFAAGTATISNYDANYTYTFSPTGPVAGANGIISGMTYGTSYTVAATNSDDCISAASASFTIEEMLPTPDAPTVQVTAATCEAAGTATITNYNEDYSYTFDPTGPLAGANGVISNMTYGTSYTVTATNSDECISAASAPFIIMDMLPTPAQPIVQVTAATCFAAGTATISNYNEDYSYTFDPTGPTAGANGLISGMDYGTSYTVTATNSDDCISAASASFTIEEMLPTPDAPTVQVAAATCEAAGTATISNYDANYTYTFSPTGPLAGANGVITGAVYGTSYTVTATNSDDCISAASASFSIMDMLPTPAQPIVQVTAATCFAAGTATISNYSEDYTYTFDPTGPTAGTGGVISGFSTDVSYTVTATSSSNCTSEASELFMVPAALDAPMQPTVQVTAATCEAAGTATITNYNEDYSYTFDPTGPLAGANGVISNMTYGTSYTVTATNSDDCISASSASFTIEEMLPTPAQPIVQVTAATCFAAGTATISNYSEDYTYTFDPTGPTAGTGGVISGFSTDVSYTVTATSSSNCTSEASELFMVPAALDAPMQPTVQVTAATCEEAGTATISNYDANYTYTFSPTGPVAGANGVITGAVYGTSYTVTATNSDDCISAASASFSIMDMLPTPAQPIVQVTAATCFAAGTATISNYSEDYTYTFDPTGPTAGTGGVISGFSTDVSYTVTATSSSNCTSEASELFMVPAALDAPMQPTVQVTAATCEAAGTATITNYNEDYSYTFDPTGPLAGANGVISNMTYGTSYTVTATNSDECISAASAPFSIMDMLPTPAQPIVQVTAATCFAAGTATISNYSEDYTYTFDPTGPTAGTGGVISGFSTDVSYTVTATSSSNCTSEASELFMVPAALDAPMQPTVQVTAATCEEAGTATISNYDANYTYTFSPTGPVAGANGVISGMTYGTSYTVAATNSDDCISAASAPFSIMEMLPTPDAPTVQVTAATCEAAGTATISNYDANYTYTFSPTGPVAGANGVITGAAYGTSYTVTATNSDDCISAASAPFSIMDMLQTPVALVTPTTGELTCTVTSILLDASGSTYAGTGDLTYSWSDGTEEVGTESTLLVTAPGTYTVTVTAENGCFATASATITQDETLPVALVTPTTGELTCTVTSILLDASGSTYAGTGDLTYSWSDGTEEVGTESTLTVTAPGTYTVTVTAENGCFATASATIIYTAEDPLANNDFKYGNEVGSAVTINILANDELCDGTPALPGLVTVDLDPSTDGIQTELTVPGEGTWSYDPATGELTFTPEAGFTTDPAPIDYTLTETATGLTDTATVTITYTEESPVAVDDSSTGNMPGDAVTVDILANDLLSDGTPAQPGLVTVDLDPLTAGIQTELTVPGEGTWSYNPATGELTFTPEAGFTTDPTPIDYTLTETATGLTDTATVTISYTEEPPVAVDDSSTGNMPGDAVTVDILANDLLSDGTPAQPGLVTVDLDPLTAGIQTELTVPGEGTWSYDPATGELTFTPEAGFTTDPTPIDYTLTETATGLTDTATVTITYTEEPPLAVDDSSTGNMPGDAVTVDILANDLLSDGTPAQPGLVTVDLDPLTAGIQTELTVPGEGTWSYDPATGELTFTPEAGFTTDPTPIVYTLTETATGLTDTATVTITYTEEPPVAVDDSSTGNMPGDAVTVDILANDLLSDGTPAQPGLVTVDLDPLTAGIQTELTVPGEGTWSYDPATGELTFTPEAGFTTDPTPIVYTLTETATGLTDTATVTITYTEEPPVAVDDSSTGNMPGDAVTVDILANDLLSDGTPAQPGLVTVDLDPSTDGIQTELTVPGEGTWSYDPATGELTFTPEAGFTTDPAPITYTLTETSTGLSDTATVTVDYTEEPPLAVDDSSTGNMPGDAVTVDILANDLLSDGTPALPGLVTVDLDPSTDGIQTELTVPGEGTWSYNPATGELTFTPEAGFTTDPTPIVYELTETATGLTDTATVTITYTEEPPVAVNDSSTGNMPGDAVTVDILANDLLSDGTPAQPGLVTVDLDPLTAGIQTELTVPGEGTWSYDPATGELTFTPEAGFTTDPTPIDYTLTETSTGLTDTATVTITYTEEPPVAVDDSSTGNMPGDAVTVDILANDLLSDGTPAQPGLVTVDLDPLTAGIQTELTVPGEGTWSYDPATGELTFTPEAGFTTDPTPIVYTLTETATGLTDTATVTITYTEEPPVAVDDSSTGNMPGDAVTVDILANDLLSDGTPAQPGLVTVDLDPSTDGIQTELTVPGEGTWSYDPATGELTFTPEAGFTTDPTPIDYTLTETSTGLTDTATVTITYTEEPPVAVDDSSTGNMPGDAVTVDILTNDLLSDGTPAQPGLVTVDLDPSTDGIQTELTVPGEGTWSYDPATGELTFTPEAGFTTDPTPIDYTLTETSTGLTDTATVTITYTEEPPVAVDDSSTGNMPGDAVTVDILANDLLSDGTPALPGLVTVDLDPLTAGIQTELTLPGEGTWSYDPATGELTFTPEAGFTTDPTPIDYTLTETSTGLTDTATVTITYTEEPPVAVDDSSTGNMPGDAVTVDILANDLLSDGTPALPGLVTVDLDPLTAGIQTELTVPGEGTWSYDPATGELTFTPEAGFTTDPTPIDYTLTETSTGLTDTATVTITYTEEPPVAVDDSSTGNMPGDAVTVDILANDLLSDGTPAQPGLVTVDLDPLTAGIQTELTVPGEGTWSYDPATGELTFTPEAGFTGDPQPLVYELIENATGLSDSAVVNVDYINPPIANDDQSLNNISGSSVTLNLLGNDTLNDDLPALPNLVTVDLDPESEGIQTTLVVSGEGTWTYNSVNGTVTFVPFAGFTVNPTPIEYLLTETATGLSDMAIVTVTYLAIPPVAEDDISTGNYIGDFAIIYILTNDNLSDGSAALPGLITVDLDSNTPGIQTTLLVPGEGVWQYDPVFGILSFTPEAGFEQNPTPIEYQLTENATGLSDNAWVIVEYVNPPIALDDSSLSNEAGTTVSLTILSNDLLSSGDPASHGLVTVDLNPLVSGTQIVYTVNGEGVWRYNPSTGIVTFTPESGFLGNPTPITYVLTDNNTRLSDTATITVTYLEIPPIAVNDSSTGNMPGDAVTVDILANDLLSDGTPAQPGLVTVDLDPLTAGIQTELTVPGEGTWSYDPATGELTFTPEAGFTTDPTPIVYELTETATGLSDMATVTITYTKEPPVAVDDNSTGNTPGDAVTVDILANDLLSDGTPAQPGLVTVDLDPLTAGIQTELTVPGEGTWSYDPATGELTFTPEAGFTTDPTPIVYTLTETATGLTDTATVTITYTEEPPVAVDDSSTGNMPGDAVTVDILANDLLSDGTPAQPGLVTVDLDPLTAGIQTELTVPGEGTWSYDPATGELTFTPEAGFTTDPTPIVYTLTETSTGLSRYGTVTIDYTEEPPVAVDDSSTGNMPG
jgi:CshA-type fibril repeat protein